MARPSNKAHRREQIARAMMKVVALRGYDGASIAEIAATAGINQGLVHYHFKSKLEVLLEVTAVLRAWHQEHLQASLDAASPEPWSQLDAFLDFHLGLGPTADPEMMGSWLVVSNEALRQPEVRQAYAEMMRDSHHALSQLIRRGTTFFAFRCDEPEAASAALLATIQGYFALAATAREIVPRGSAARSAKRMARGLLEARP